MNSTEYEDVEVSVFFRWSAIISMFVLSFLGTLLNSMLLFQFLTKKGKYTGFEKLCTVKTFPNVIISIAVLCWAVPTTISALNYDEMPLDMNRIIGIVSGIGAYLFGPIIQSFMAFNRFFVLYFPFKIQKMDRSPVFKIAIFGAFIAAVAICVPAVPEMCAYVYDPDYYSWRVEDSECGEWNALLLMWVIITLSCISNSFNVIVISKLLFEKVGSAPGYASKRKKRFLLMFTQSVIQDCIHVIDIINTIYTYKLSDEIWFQFIFLSASFSFIYTFDGFVMLYFHPDVQPIWLRSILRKQQINQPVMVSSTILTIT